LNWQIAIALIFAPFVLWVMSYSTSSAYFNAKLKYQRDLMNHLNNRKDH